MSEQSRDDHTSYLLRLYYHSTLPADAGVDDNTIRAALERMMRVRPDLCLLLSLRYGEDFSQRTIAEALGRSPSTIGTLLREGLARLAGELGR